jgi:phosphopentomutase
VPLDELYQACETARAMLVGEHSVSRVIARPFGEAGHFARTANRRDFSVPPTGASAGPAGRSGIPRVGVGRWMTCSPGAASPAATPTNGDAYR